MGLKKTYIPEVRMVETVYNGESAYGFEFLDWQIVLFNRVIFKGIWRNIRSTEDSYSISPYSYATKQAAVKALLGWFKDHGICANVIDIKESMTKAVYDVELLIKDQS
jgi:hypothetical protein